MCEVQVGCRCCISSAVKSVSCSNQGQIAEYVACVVFKHSNFSYIIATSTKIY